MEKPKNLLQLWDSIPHIEPSEDWQNKLMEQTESALHSPPSAWPKVIYLLIGIVFVAINILFIAYLFQDDLPEIPQREQELKELSKEFLIDTYAVN
jgi:hypothetical protein